jgi:hypothetical protein
VYKKSCTDGDVHDEEMITCSSSEPFTVNTICYQAPTMVASALAMAVASVDKNAVAHLAMADTGRMDSS